MDPKDLQPLTTENTEFTKESKKLFIRIFAFLWFSVTSVVKAWLVIILEGGKEARVELIEGNN